jgi:hypothetical protein
MDKGAAIAMLSELGRAQCGVFRGRVAVTRGVTRRQLTALVAQRVIDRLLPDVYRLTAVPLSEEQRAWAAVLWAGPSSAAYGRSSGAWYGLEGVRAWSPEVVVGPVEHPRHRDVGVSALDPVHPSRSTLEVKTRRLLVERGLTGFVRDHPRRLVSRA